MSTFESFAPHPDELRHTTPTGASDSGQSSSSESNGLGSRQIKYLNPTLKQEESIKKSNFSGIKSALKIIGISIGIFLGFATAIIPLAFTIVNIINAARMSTPRAEKLKKERDELKTATHLNFLKSSVEVAEQFYTLKPIEYAKNLSLTHFLDYEHLDLIWSESIGNVTLSFADEGNHNFIKSIANDRNVNIKELEKKITNDLKDYIKIMSNKKSVTSSQFNKLMYDLNSNLPVFKVMVHQDLEPEAYNNLVDSIKKTIDYIDKVKTNEGRNVKKFSAETLSLAQEINKLGLEKSFPPAHRFLLQFRKDSNITEAAFNHTLSTLHKDLQYILKNNELSHDEKQVFNQLDTFLRTLNPIINYTSIEIAKQELERSNLSNLKTIKKMVPEAKTCIDILSKENPQISEKDFQQIVNKLNTTLSKMSSSDLKKQYNESEIADFVKFEKIIWNTKYQFDRTPKLTILKKLNAEIHKDINKTSRLIPILEKNKFNGIIDSFYYKKQYSDLKKTLLEHIYEATSSDAYKNIKSLDPKNAEVLFLQELCYQLYTQENNNIAQTQMFDFCDSLNQEFQSEIEEEIKNNSPTQLPIHSNQLKSSEAIADLAEGFVKYTEKYSYDKNTNLGKVFWSGIHLERAFHSIQSEHAEFGKFDALKGGNAPVALGEVKFQFKTSESPKTIRHIMAASPTIGSDINPLYSTFLDALENKGMIITQNHLQAPHKEEFKRVDAGIKLGEERSNVLRVNAAPVDGAVFNRGVGLLYNGMEITIGNEKYTFDDKQITLENTLIFELDHEKETPKYYFLKINTPEAKNKGSVEIYKIEKGRETKITINGQEILIKAQPYKPDAFAEKFQSYIQKGLKNGYKSEEEGGTGYYFSDDSKVNLQSAEKATLELMKQSDLKELSTENQSRLHQYSFQLINSIGEMFQAMKKNNNQVWIEHCKEDIDRGATKNMLTTFALVLLALPDDKIENITDEMMVRIMAPVLTRSQIAQNRTILMKRLEPALDLLKNIKPKDLKEQLQNHLKNIGCEIKEGSMNLPFLGIKDGKIGEIE